MIALQSRLALGASIVLLAAGIARADWIDGADASSGEHGALRVVSDTSQDWVAKDAAAAVTEDSKASEPSCGCHHDCECDCCDACDCCDYCPAWTVKAGAVILTRANPHPAVLLEDTVTGDPLANARDLTFNWAGGPDVAITRHFNSTNGLEVRYFGVDGLRAQEAVTTSAIWNFPTNPPLFGLGVADVGILYASRLHSTEINLRHASNDRIEWLVGFRWVEVHENLSFDADFGGNQALIADNTDNHLYGGQIGTDIILWRNEGAFSIDSVFKAGIYGNSADNTFGVTQQIGPAFGTQDHSSKVAFVGEVGLTGALQLTDHIAVRGGYQLLWIDGAALAPDQLAAIDVINASGIDVTGDAFYHGALMSVDFTW